MQIETRATDEKRGPGNADNAAVKRRKACRSASWTGGPRNGTGPSARRARGAAIRTGACRRFTPSDRGKFCAKI